MLAPQTKPAGTLETLALTTVNPAGTSKTTHPIISLPSLTVATMLVATPCVIEVGARVSVHGFAAWTAAGAPSMAAQPSQASARAATSAPLRAAIRRPAGPGS